MNKIKILLLFGFIFSYSLATAQIRTNAYYDGYWGEWKDQWLPSIFSSRPSEFYYNLYGNESGFIIYDKNEHPSNYFFKFQINNYVEPTKKQIKDHYKQNQWYVYTGTVEYYVVESAPTIKDILKKWGIPLYGKDDYDTYDGHRGPSVKRIANATIKIAPYKNTPRVYNFLFDDVGFAIELVYVSF